MKFELVEIDILETESYNGYTYDLEVDEDHSYNIDGIVVHNSVCTTRLVTGVGYPQLSAIIECSDAAHGLGAHIVADGGCTCPGDVAKAFGAGADFVMLGGLLAGHDEGGGEVKDGKITFYGMSSDTAMDKHHGGVAEYRSSEGRTVEIPYKGAVKTTVLDLLGGLRSACSYVGAPTLKQLSKCTTFIRVTKQYNDIFVR
jgi:GMP reductase